MTARDDDIVASIVKVLDRNESFLLLNHTHPDGDAVGSQLALHMVLTSKGKRSHMYSAQDVRKDYSFLPGVEEVRGEIPEDGRFDVAIALDCANPGRISDVLDLTRCGEVINIDHHVSNTEYGTVNWVVPGSSSTGELVYELVRRMGVTPDPEMATCLYTAMYTDTGGFRHSNTGAPTLRIASVLVECGANPANIARHVYSDYPERRFRLLGNALRTLRTAEGGRAAYMWVRCEDYEETGSSIADADEFVEYPRAIKGVAIAVLFKEQVGTATARVNFRSNDRRFNVNRIASAFGGGGHAEAAACDIEGTREEIERSVLEGVRAELRDVKASREE